MSNIKIIANDLEIILSPTQTYNLQIGDTKIMITKEQADGIINEVAALTHETIFEDFDETFVELQEVIEDEW